MPEVKSPKRAAGWTKVAFGDVVRLCTERSSDPEADGFERYIGLEHLDPGELRVRRWGDLADGVTFTNVFRPGQVLFGKRRAYQRKVAVADFSGVCSGDIYVLEPKDDALLLELLPFICQTEAFFEHAVGTSAGSLSPRTNWESLASFEFVLPPIDEQRRLGKALVATQSALDRLVDVEQEASSAAAAVLDFHLARLASTTPTSLVGDLLVDGPKNGLSPIANSEARGFRTVSIGAVSDGCFDPEGHVKHVDLTTDDAHPYLVREGDIFAVRGNGNRQLVGRVGRSAASYDDLIYPDLLIRMRFDPERVNPEFLIAQWNHAPVHARLLARAKSSNGIYKVNGQDIRAHDLLMPSLPQQNEVVASMQAIAAASSMAKSRTAVLRRIKGELMRAMLGVADE